MLLMLLLIRWFPHVDDKRHFSQCEFQSIDDWLRIHQPGAWRMGYRSVLVRYRAGDVRFFLRLLGHTGGYWL